MMRAAFTGVDAMKLTVRRPAGHAAATRRDGFLGSLTGTLLARATCRPIVIPAFLFCMLIGAASLCFGSGNQEQQLTIYYTASLNGNLDGCHCKEAPKAGLVKRAVFLNQLPDDDSYLLLDGGDIFDVYPDPLLEKAILGVYDTYGYDIIAVGDQEFSGGVDRFLEYREDHPFLCHNLVLYSDTYGKVELGGPPPVLERAGLRVAVISVVDPDVFALYPKDIRSRVRVVDPLEAVRSGVDGADITLLLYHGPLAKARKLAGEVDGIDIIIVTHEQKLVNAETAGETLLVSPGAQGNRIGILSITVKKDKTVEFENSFMKFSYEDDPDDPYVRDLINIYYSEMTKKLQERKSE